MTFLRCGNKYFREYCEYGNFSNKKHISNFEIFYSDITYIDSFIKTKLLINYMKRILANCGWIKYDLIK